MGELLEPDFSQGPSRPRDIRYQGLSGVTELPAGSSPDQDSDIGVAIIMTAGAIIAYKVMRRELPTLEGANLETIAAELSVVAVEMRERMQALPPSVRDTAVNLARREIAACYEAPKNQSARLSDS